MTKDELVKALETEGYAGAAADIINGVDIRTATAYLAGGLPNYMDEDGRRLQAFIDGLHNGRTEA